MTTTSAPFAVPLITSDPPPDEAWTWLASSAAKAFTLAMYCRSTSRPFLAKMPLSLATHSDRLSAIRLLYAMPIFLIGTAVGAGVGAAGWAADEHAARSRATRTQIGGNSRRISLTGYKVSWHARCTAALVGG